MNSEMALSQLEKEIASRFGLESLRSGGHTIRNDKGWRDNEIEIDYIWLIFFEPAFSENGGIINIKYKESQFREIKNAEKLEKAIFSLSDKHKILSFYKEEESENFSNLLQAFNKLDLFEQNKGITLDGISYRIKLFTMNTVVTIDLNNPNHESWRELELEILQMGKAMSERSNNVLLKKLF